MRRYVGCGSGDIAWDFIRLAWGAVAETAICPLQDVLGLGGEARMNFPGVAAGNWTWRFREEALRPELALRLRDVTALYGRIGHGVEKKESTEGE